AAAVAAWWLGCDLAATMLSARGLTHYVQQAEPALAVVAGLAAVAVLRSAPRWGPALALGLLLLSFPFAQLTLWVPRAEVALAQGALVVRAERPAAGRALRQPEQRLQPGSGRRAAAAWRPHRPPAGGADCSPVPAAGASRLAPASRLREVARRGRGLPVLAVV